MGTVKIYLKLQDGKLDYRDTEKHEGKTIISEVNPGDKVVWKLDENSGIKSIKDVSINGSAGFFNKGPKQKDAGKWNAKVAETATGEVSYNVSYESESGDTGTVEMRSSQVQTLSDSESPKLVIPD